jgi:hypothetical protein
MSDPIDWHPEDGAPSDSANYARWNAYIDNEGPDANETPEDASIRRTSTRIRRQMGALLPAAQIEAMARRIVGLPSPTITTTPALELVETWIRTAKSSGRYVLALVSSTGTGKTFAAARVFEYSRARYVTARDATKLAGSLYGDAPTKWAELLEAPVLVIDEIGAWSDRTQEPAAITEALDRRQFGKGTLLLSNLTPAELDAYLGERAASRLAQVSAVIPVGGADLRRKARA